MIEIFFATNRNVLSEGDEPKFGNAFNPAGPHALRYGSAQVEKRRGDYEVKSIYLAPENIPTEKGGTPLLGSRTVYEELRSRMAADKIDVIGLIHGYASDIESALARAAELKDKYRVEGRKPHVFVFSWPSDGAMAPWLSYYSDRDDARASGLAIARGILKLRDFLIDLGRERHCEQSIHLVAHSMGNYALRHALQCVVSHLGRELPRFFDNVFLMAADEDDDAFEHDYKFRLLPELAKAVHVYFTPDDRALVISDVTKRNPDRLGSLGPRIRENVPRKLVLVDCRNVDRSEGDLSNHQYYRLRPEVVADVNHVLSGQSANEIPDRDYVPEDRSYRIRAQPRRAKKPSKAKAKMSGPGRDR